MAGAGPTATRDTDDGGAGDGRDPDRAFVASLGIPVPPEPVTTSWSPVRRVHAEHVMRVAELLARWELGSAHRLRAAARRSVMTEREYLALRELAVRPDGLVGTELADIIGVGSGGISGIIMRLEEQELLERAPDPDDRRGMVSFATDAGRAFARAEVEDVSDPRGVSDLLEGLRASQIDLIVAFVGDATNRAYRQAQHLRDQRRRQR